MCYVILSDIHANYTALEAVLGAVAPIERKKFYFLGDLLGYGPLSQVEDCVNWLHDASQPCQENGDAKIHWVPGNHDEWAVLELGHMRPEGSITLRIQSTALSRNCAHHWGWFAAEVSHALTDESRSLLTKTRKNGAGELFMAFTHAAVAPAEERRGTYLRPWQPDILRAHFAPLRDMTAAQTKILCCGHTHLPYLARILPDERHTLEFLSIKYGKAIALGPGEYIISPGSVGHPRDGDPRAAFALFEPESCTVEFRRVKYDTHLVMEELKKESSNLRDVHEAARFLIQLDAPMLKFKVDLDNLPPKLKHEYRQRVDQAYQHLVHEIETGAGGEEEQNYRTIYRTPEWDLEAVNGA